MGLLDFINSTKKNYRDLRDLERDSLQHDKVGTIEIPDRLTNENAFLLCNTVAELYHPIDFIADRASKLRYYIADKNGNEVKNTELNRFINDINPFYSFNDLVYQYIFSLYADGNAFVYRQVPTTYNNLATVNNISRVDLLIPNLVSIQEYSNISILNVSNRSDIIRKVRYSNFNGFYENLDTNNLMINVYDANIRNNSLMLCKSPMFKAYRSVNNLLATYSARYNVYANNGSAGYLVHDKKANNSMQDAIDPVDRESILKDINERNGITGKRNFWGISSIPLKFINTLSSIKDLLPFEETLEDSIKIGAIYQIPSGLISRKDQSTYDNKDTDERSVWENTLISTVEETAKAFTKIFTLDKKGYSIGVDYSCVSVLNDNVNKKEEIKTKKIDNLIKLRQLDPNIDLKNEIEMIINL